MSAGRLWISDANRIPLAQVFHELGIPRIGKGERYACPSCRAEHRYPPDDKRGPVYPRVKHGGWACGAHGGCKATGGNIDAVGHVLGVGPTAPEVRAWFASRGCCVAAPDAPPVPRVTPRPPPPPPPPKGRPSGLLDWWAQLGPVDTDDEVSGYLRGRGIDPATVADRDLARALPEALRPPSWGYTGGYRLVVPAYDAAGALASVRLRRVVAGDGPKSLAPRGCDASGIVFADGLGRQLLRHTGLPEWWPADRALRIVICEGEIDWLALASATGDGDECAPALLGLGNWTPDLAARIPDAAVVYLATDNDPTGDKYAATIARTLAGRVELRRWHPPETRP